MHFFASRRRNIEHIPTEDGGKVRKTGKKDGNSTHVNTA